MSAAFLLAAAGLLLIPAAYPARQRLAWLAHTRWHVEQQATNAPPAPGFQLEHLEVSGCAGIAALAGLLVAVVAGPVPGVLLALTGVVLGFCWQLLRRERRAAADLEVLSSTVGAILAEHAAGASLASALGRAAAAAGRYRPALVAAARCAAVGDQPATGLAAEPALTRVAVASELVANTGASINDVLERVRADVRAEQHTRRTVAEAVAGPRSSALLLAMLPLAGLAMGAALGGNPAHVLLRTTAGLAALSTGVLLDLAGLCWTLRLTTGSRSGSRRVP